MSGPVEFSVVIPLYNKAPYVEAALRSALADGNCVREVIVVDDGSTDDSAERVESLADPRVRLVRQANAGVSRARNRGVELARFEWVAFLDADDFWLPDYIPALARLAVRYPDCDMLGSMYVVSDDEGNRWPPSGEWALEPAASLRIDDFHGAMAKGHLCFTGSIAVRRSLIQAQQIRFPEGEQLGEDLDFFFLAAEHTSMAYCSQPLVVYRDADQVSRLSQARVADLVPPFLRRMESRWQAGAIPAPKRRGVERYIANHYESIVLKAIRAGQRRPALPLLLHPLLRARLSRWIGLIACWLLPVSWGERILGWRKSLAHAW